MSNPPEWCDYDASKSEQWCAQHKCCNRKQQCPSNFCPSGYANKPNYNDFYCSGKKPWEPNTCLNRPHDIEQCCLQRCHNHQNNVCGNGYELRDNAGNIPCSSVLCSNSHDRNTCCLQRCHNNHGSVCGNGYVLRNNAGDIPCSSHSCSISSDRDTCCLQLCHNHHDSVCGNGYVLRDNAGEIRCSSHLCSISHDRDTCCKQKCSGLDCGSGYVNDPHSNNWSCRQDVMAGPAPGEPFAPSRGLQSALAHSPPTWGPIIAEHLLSVLADYLPLPPGPFIELSRATCSVDDDRDKCCLQVCHAGVCSPHVDLVLRSDAGTHTTCSKSNHKPNCDSSNWEDKTTCCRQRCTVMGSSTPAALASSAPQSQICGGNVGLGYFLRDTAANLQCDSTSCNFNHAPESKDAKTCCVKACVKPSDSDVRFQFEVTPDWDTVLLQWNNYPGRHNDPGQSSPTSGEVTWQCRPDKYEGTARFYCRGEGHELQFQTVASHDASTVTALTRTYDNNGPKIAHEKRCWARCSAVDCSQFIGHGSTSRKSYYQPMRANSANDPEEVEYCAHERPASFQTDCKSSCCKHACRAPLPEDAVAYDINFVDALQHPYLYPGRTNNNQNYWHIDIPHMITKCAADYHSPEGEQAEAQCEGEGADVRLRGCIPTCRCTVQNEQSIELGDAEQDTTLCPGPAMQRCANCGRKVNGGEYDFRPEPSTQREEVRCWASCRSVSNTGTRSCKQYGTHSSGAYYVKDSSVTYCDQQEYEPAHTTEKEAECCELPTCAFGFFGKGFECPGRESVSDDKEPTGFIGHGHPGSSKNAY
eukprot:g14039.t1